MEIRTLVDAIDMHDKIVGDKDRKIQVYDILRMVSPHGSISVLVLDPLMFYDETETFREPIQVGDAQNETSLGIMCIPSNLIV